MSDGDRRHEATPQRLQQARRRGEIQFSADVVPVLVLILAGSIMVSTADDWLMAWRSLLQAGWTEQAELPELLRRAAWLTFVPVLLLGTCSLGLGLGNRLLQTKTLFSLEALRLDWSRLSLSSALGRFKQGRAGMQFARMLGLTLCLGVVTRYGLLPFARSLHGAPETLEGFADLLAAFRGRVFWPLIVGLMALAGLDAWAQWLLSRRRLRMTDQELKEERKRSEGNPEIRARRRRMQAGWRRTQLNRTVPSATVVVRNPTHYAVALRYAPLQQDVPIVVAKGRDHLALRIIQIAVQNDVPVATQPRLARALHARCAEGEPVPEELFQDVAIILARIDQVRREIAR
ncbi:MAG: EscU/YscU/HrcU family type III secretion system export apparatus switch protein [Candidatus Dadabacteria bacterium]|nr:MAG: EscU/YscU/HrcU family type III secretion system export apparatus switch protein [Candidatus Dadabacteria bacterium]